jgi:hypothetical protein
LADASAENEDMKTMIARMHKKYGGFRHVTEDILLKEIAGGNNGYTEQEDDDAEQEKGTPEYLMEKKATMVQELGYGLSTPSAIADLLAAP